MEISLKCVDLIDNFIPYTVILLMFFIKTCKKNIILITQNLF